MTDGDSDTLQSMRRNVENNLHINDTTSISCHQLRWGKNYIPNFTSSCSTNKFDIIIASDVIYVEEIINDLFDTVMELLDDDENSMFVLAFVRRNVKIDLVLEYACNECLLDYTCYCFNDDDDSAIGSTSEGIYVFQRKS